jgi:D-tyrosyl-tRNA(Tyr) deacylase
MSHLQNFSFASTTELLGYARMKPDATLEWTAKWRAQTRTGFCTYKSDVMRTVIQRVKRAEVRSGGQSASIDRGFLLLVGLENGDTTETTAWCANKIAGLRIFEDSNDKMNLSLADVGGEVLAVSQFTLAGSIAKGRRPGFDAAMPPAEAGTLFDIFVSQLKALQIDVKTGFFREHMEVELINDGPVTFVLERGHS